MNNSHRGTHKTPSILSNYVSIQFSIDFQAVLLVSAAASCHAGLLGAGTGNLVVVVRGKEGGVSTHGKIRGLDGYTP